MAYVINGRKLNNEKDWRISTAQKRRTEHQEVYPQQDGSIKQVIEMEGGIRIETVLSADGKSVVTNINREVAVDDENGLIIILDDAGLNTH
ncbi:MAG: hypothetical protein H0Z39_02200 [Peptococcaceae bacterium]|nr:hypothetical protein [Peptococcaceae bacterium]